MSDERKFSEDEVEAILKLAITRQDQGGGLSRDELRETVSQLGITGDELDDAIAEHDDQKSLRTQVDAWKADRLRRLRSQAWSFGAVILGLALINLLTSPGALWFIWPMLGWGTGLAIQYAAYLQGPDAQALEAYGRVQARRDERARRKSEKAERKARRRERDEALKRASEELGNAVKSGVTGFMENLSRSLRDAADAAETPAARPQERTRVRVSGSAAAPEPPSEEELDRELEAMRKKKRGG